MQIESVSLVNFKSYAEATVKFTPGVNAIIGHNGAGKSTILEAIGFALFDYSNKGAERRLREGCNHGQVTVCFVSSLDERKYTVERSFDTKGTARYRVLDEEAGLILAEGVALVQNWLRTHMRLESETKLDYLFRHTIGIPQGTFTAPFLEEAAVRKAIFDPLLQVEEYQKASEKLLPTGRQLTRTMNELQADSARLEGMLASLPGYEAEQKSLVAEIASITESAKDKALEVEQLQHSVTAFDQAQADVLTAERNEKDAQGKLALSEQLYATGAKQAEQARQAQKLVQENQEEHELYQALEAGWQELNAKRAKRDQIVAKLAELRATRAGLQARMEARKQELDQAIAAGVKVEELEPKVKQQESFEQQLIDYGQRLALLDSDITRITEQRNALDEMGATCPLCGNDITAEHKNALLAAHQQEINEYSADTSNIHVHCDSIHQALAALGNPRREQDALRVLAERIKARSDEFDRVSKQAEELDATIARGETALAEYDDLDETIANAEIKRQALSYTNQVYVANSKLAEQYEELQDRRVSLLNNLENARESYEHAQVLYKRAADGYNAREHTKFKSALVIAQGDLASSKATLQAKTERLIAVRASLKEMQSCQGDLAEKQQQLQEVEQASRILDLVREWLKAAGPLITRRMVARISQEASGIYADIMDTQGATLHWAADYELELEQHGIRRAFRQLSGGEQMIAALALRLALLRHTSAIDIAFFDEPTAHLDPERRDGLAEKLMAIRGFRQLFVISHDDTFSRAAANYVSVSKGDEGSVVADRGTA